MKSEKPESAIINSQNLPSNVTLNPILSDGPDAFDPQGIAEIQKIRLLEVKYAQKNVFHQVTTKEADDLIACIAKDPAHPNLVPPDATLLAATLGFQIAGSAEPQLVELRPRKTPQLLCSTGAASIIAWIWKSAFNASQTLTRVALVLLLAVTTASAAVLDDDDDDDDDHGDRRTSVAHLARTRRTQSLQLWTGPRIEPV